MTRISGVLLRLRHCHVDIMCGYKWLGKMI